MTYSQVNGMNKKYWLIAWVDTGQMYFSLWVLKEKLGFTTGFWYLSCRWWGVLSGLSWCLWVQRHESGRIWSSSCCPVALGRGTLGGSTRMSLFCLDSLRHHASALDRCHPGTTLLNRQTWAYQHRFPVSDSLWALSMHCCVCSPSLPLL